MNETLKAPFPWFGGKSKVAELVWSRFGCTGNYVEPFAGSLAVLLGRPHEAATETVNDKDAFLSNFWRAIQFDPETTARWADWPVSEPDLEARHRWLMNTGAARLELVKADPHFFDAQVAGWWVWGLCSWIGSGWCVQRRNGDQPRQMPHCGNAGMGINRQLAPVEVYRKRPHLMSSKGINSERGADILAYFEALSDRLRRVRVCCGDWTRVLGESVTVNHGMTAVFLDPPYGGEIERDNDLYAADSLTVSQDVRAWAIANGGNPLLRIALCGYEGEHTMPPEWECIAWKAGGGYGSQANGLGRQNSTRERIWFSPACIRPEEELFPLCAPNAKIPQKSALFALDAPALRA